MPSAAADPSLYLMIIGEGPFRKELEALAQSYGLGGRIIFTGAVPHEQISPYYACCNAYATASLSEMYSISMLEAQASGLPVVQWLDPDNIDQIKVGVNGYLFETAEEFGRIIHQLADVTPSSGLSWPNGFAIRSRNAAATRLQTICSTSTSRQLTSTGKRRSDQTMF